MYYFSLECTSKKAITKSKVKVDVQQGVLRFKEELENRFGTYIQFKFSFAIVKWQ